IHTVRVVRQHRCRVVHQLRLSPFLAEGQQLRRLRCTLLNARSIVNKLSELYHMLYADQPDIVLITETWLQPDIMSGLLDPESHYHLIRKDRDTRGGGVCAFISRSFNIVPVELVERYNCLEILCFDMLCCRSSLRFFVVYRPPYSDADSVKNLELLLECLDVYGQTANANIITGDLNCPGVDWKCLNCSNDNISRLFLDFCIKHGFYQCVNFATRDNNILDIILVDDDQLINSVSAKPPLGSSDHSIVEL